MFLEAMRCGTRAIGLSVGGAPDALADGDLGVCVSPADFAAALKSSLFDKPPSPETLSNQVANRFGRTVFNNNVENILMRLN